jgi:hypothetical protein
MHIKYFQPIADINYHYEDALRHYDDSNFGQYGHMLLKTWGLNETDEKDLIEEREVLEYLLACRLTIARHKSAKKPSLKVVERLFNRHLVYLEKIHKCDAYNVNKHRSKNIQKQYKACRHYLFKFSLPAWYDKLPNVIPTFEEKYGILKKETNIIPNKN